MNDLRADILSSFPGAKFSCRECGSSNVRASERHDVSATNPLGERMAVFYCGDCGLIDEVINPENVREVVKSWLVESVRLYTCSFLFRGMDYDTSTIKGIDEFKNGFWTNVNHEYTTGSDCIWWIPPGKIEDVTVKTTVRRLSE